MGGTIGVVLDKPSRRDKESGRPLWGDMGHVLRRTLAHFGVDLDRDCAVSYVVPAFGVVGANMDLVRPNMERVQTEMAGVDKILCCGPLAVAATYPWHCVPTRYHKFRGRGYRTSWGAPPKFCMPTYSVQQVWSEPNFFRDLAFDVQKLVAQDGPQPRPEVETLVIGRDTRWDDPRDELAHWIKQIAGASIVACDLETRGFDPHKDAIISIGFGVMRADAPHKGKAIIVPEEMLYPRDPSVVRHLRRFFGADSPFKGALVFQNMQFDLRFLYAYLGEWVRHPGLSDTLLLNYALDERPIGGKYSVHSLKDMARYRFDAEDFAWDWKAWYAKPPEEQATDLDAMYVYNGIDTFYTARLYEILSAEMDAEDPALASLARDLLIPGAQAIAKVVHAGVLIDQGYLREYRKKLVADMGTQRAAAVAYAEGLGVHDFNPASPQQVSRLLFDVLGLPVPPKGQKKKSDRDDDAFSFDRERQEETDSSTSKDVLDRVRKGATEPQRAFITTVLTYRLFAKTLGTYVDGLLGGRKLPDGTFSAPKISVDGRVHPDLLIAGTATGRLSCVARGTPVETVRDVSVSPKGIPIENVRVGDYAYTFDNERRLTLKRVLWAGKTGHRSVIRLHWLGDGRHHRGHVDVTPEHPIRLVDGTYRRADELRPGHRVMALSRGLTCGYARLWATGHEEIGKEHRFIAQTLTGEKWAHTHHLNGNKLDNRFVNLVGMSAQEHTAFHGQNVPESLRTKRSEDMRRRWAEGGVTVRSGDAHPHFKSLDPAWMERVLWDNAGKPTAFRDVYGFDYGTIMRELHAHGLDWRAIRAHFTGDDRRMTAGLVEQGRTVHETHGADAARKFMCLGYYRWRDAQQSFGYTPYNHVITKVELLSEHVDVYDIEIEGTHNFIAGELCVHNSSTPNLQNIPLHTGPEIRRAFIAPPGYTLAEIDFSQLELRVAAWFSQEPVLVTAFQSGQDIHRMTASQVFGKPLDKVSEHERFMAKAVSFGLLFGRSAEAIAEGREMDLLEEQTGTRWSLEKARDFHDQFLARMPVLTAWMERHIKETFAAHRTVTPFGRIRRFPLVHYHRRGEIERKAINTVIQSTASDICFSALIRLVDALPPEARVVLTVHDSILLEIRDDVVPAVIALARDTMGHPPLEDRGIPWATEAKVGKNWEKMEKWEGDPA